MKIKSFLKLVEIQTKVASMFPFLLGTVFTLYYFDSFNLVNFSFMFVSLICIDMATTTINNYVDYKKANKREGYGYEKHNAIVKDDIKEIIVLITIFSLLLIATIFGVLLFIKTDYVVLILGAISFLIGITYSFGPVPISRTPFGEIFSGGFMGLIIPFIAVYIHVFDQGVLNIDYINNHLLLALDLSVLSKIVLISIPVAVGIANIMLANNICDIEDDIENKRYTLPIYIGKKHALNVYRALYLISFVSIVVALALNVLPLIASLTLLTFIIIHKNTKIFMENQSKEKTFPLTVQNFLLQNVVLVVTIGLGILIDSLV